MGASAAAAAIAAREKHIVAVFRTAKATSPEAAVAPGDLGVTERLAFRRLQEHGVIREVRAGLCYLDEARWAALVARRRTIATVLMLIVAVGLLLAAIVVRFVSAH